jgi:hypothetical protein
MTAENVAPRCSTTGRHAPPPGLAFGEPDDRLLRGIQYTAAFRRDHEWLGIPDHPLSRMMTAEDMACLQTTDSLFKQPRPFGAPAECWRIALLHKDRHTPPEGLAFGEPD